MSVVNESERKRLAWGQNQRTSDGGLAAHEGIAADCKSNRALSQRKRRQAVRTLARVAG